MSRNDFWTKANGEFKHFRTNHSVHQLGLHYYYSYSIIIIIINECDCD